MKLNKRGVGAIGAIFLFIVFIVMWFIWLSPLLTSVGQQAVISGDLTGVEALAFNNMNFIVLICMLLGIMGFMYFGANQ
jgi:hypothetical protein